MRIAVLGTGMVGRAIAGKLDSLGHDVVVGTRDPEATLARTEADAMGNRPFSDYQAEHPGIRLTSFAVAGAEAELVVHAISGAGELTALEAVGADALAGKVLLDIAQPLDFSQGMPPLLSVANTDSLAEKIQRTFPDARVVKSLNTVYAEVMVDPSRIPGRHNIFIAGEDTAAKDVVQALLRDFGWPEGSVLDLGGIRNARGTEMMMPLFFTLATQLGNFDLNFSVVTSGSSPSMS